MMFGDKLKEARLAKNLKQSELAQRLDVRNTTISNWEKGVSNPDVEIVSSICEILDVPASYFFEGMASKEILSFSEKEHIKKYRGLEECDKKLVNDIIERLSISRRIEHAKEFIMLQPPLLVPYYGHVASAGTGQYVFDDIPPEMIEIENEMDNMQVDFAIGVNGDSMEPTYHDGDTLLIKKQSDINIGEIGIFMINGEAFVKELGDGVLISHNKKYEDIHINDSVICLGKVISKHIS